MKNFYKISYKNILARCCLIFTLAISLAISTGCTTLDGPDNPDDPLESFNRSMYAFNDAVDRAVIKPVAKGYDFIMPSFASKGVSNFFSNLDDIVVFANELLQFKFNDALATSARFVYNTTFGLLGLIDVAKHMDLPKKNEDFDQTLAVWGVDSGPYIVLPLLGSQTVRSTAGFAVDAVYFDPILSDQTVEEALSTFALKFIDIRASLLKASNIIETTPDKYAFTRDAWLARRQFLIHDGNPPDTFNEDNLFEDDLFKDDFSKDDLSKDELILDDPVKDEPLNDTDELK